MAACPHAHSTDRVAESRPAEPSRGNLRSSPGPEDSAPLTDPSDLLRGNTRMGEAGEPPAPRALTCQAAAHQEQSEAVCTSTPVCLSVFTCTNVHVHYKSPWGV